MKTLELIEKIVQLIMQSDTDGVDRVAALKAALIIVDSEPIAI
jgi:hypothetical protein